MQSIIAEVIRTTFTKVSINILGFIENVWNYASYRIIHFSTGETIVFLIILVILCIRILLRIDNTPAGKYKRYKAQKDKAVAKMARRKNSLLYKLGSSLMDFVVCVIF